MATRSMSPGPGPRGLTHLRAVLAAGACLLAVLWAARVTRDLGVAVYPEQFLSLMLGLALAIVFLRDRSGAPASWLDRFFALCGFTAAGWFAVRYQVVIDDMIYDPSSGLLLGSVLLILVLEALRRVAGWPLTIIVSVFLLYGFFGDKAPGAFTALTIDPSRLVTQVAFDSNGMMGLPLLIAATVVVVFVLFGQLLSESGGSRFFTDLSLSIMGRYRGGAAKISIVASGLFGSISGSAVANVVTTGIITIPLMKKSGMSAESAAGVEASASTGGQLMPPIMGASAFLMAEFLNIPYVDVASAALLPALLYYVSLFVQVDLMAARSGIAALAPGELPQAGAILKVGWGFPLPFAAIIFALFVLHYDADLAGLVGIVTLLFIALIFGFGSGRLRLDGLGRTLSKAGSSAADIIIITAAAGVIIGILNETGLSFGLTNALTRMSGDSVMGLLLLAAVISMVLGMGMPTVAVYVLLAAIVVPSLVSLDVEPIAAHLFVLYFGMLSMITPPVAIAAYAAASLAGASPLRSTFHAMAFAWPSYVIPFLFMMSPELLLRGTITDNLVTLAATATAIWLISIAIVGFFRSRLAPARRILLVLLGVVLCVPALHAGWTGAVVLVGAVLLAYPLLNTAATPALPTRDEKATGH